MAEDTEPRNDVDPRPVQPLELPANVWVLVKQYSYRHEQWCKVTITVFADRVVLAVASQRATFLVRVR